jgi:SH3-like domain-containing protein
VIPLKDKILFKKPSNFSEPLAKIKMGRVLIVQKCEKNWCKIKTEKFKGWIEQGNIWGLAN